MAKDKKSEKAAQEIKIELQVTYFNPLSKEVTKHPTELNEQAEILLVTFNPELHKITVPNYFKASIQKVKRPLEKRYFDKAKTPKDWIVKVLKELHEELDATNIRCIQKTGKLFWYPVVVEKAKSDERVIAPDFIACITNKESGERSYWRACKTSALKDRKNSILRELQNLSAPFPDEKVELFTREGSVEGRFEEAIALYRSYQEE